MSNYTQSTNFATKDALTSGDPLKIVKGTEINTEFVNIAVAVATKADLASPTFTGNVTGTFVGNVTGNASTATTATNVSGTVAVANGGTGATTLTGVVIGNGTSAFTVKTNPSGAFVGTTDTQTLTNKTLTTPTIDSAQVNTISGTAPLFMARAWVNFNGTGTVAIRASGNVTSITDNGVADYTVNFTTAMTDANYAVTAALSNLTTNTADSRSNQIFNLATSSVQIFTTADTALNYIAIFR